jgi:hypothetical protein
MQALPVGKIFQLIRKDIWKKTSKCKGMEEKRSKFEILRTIIWTLCP